MAIGNLFGSGGESNSLYGTSLSNGGIIPAPSSFIYFEWFIFKVSASQPATPTGGSWDFLTNTGTPPTGWTSFVNGIPLDNLWFCVAFVDSRNPTNVTWSTTGLISATTSVYASAYADKFTGNGSTTAWTLSADPVVVNNLDVSVNGVTQTPTTDYTISGTTFTTTTAAPLGSIILVKYRQALPNSYYGAASNVGFTPSGWIASTNVQAALAEVATDISATDGVSGSNLVGYKSAGSGAVATTVQTKLRQTVSVKDFGAVGDGTTNDTAAIQAALDSGAQEVTVPWGTYKITGLEIKSASVLTSFRGIGTPVLSLVTSSGAKAITVSKSQFLTVSGFNITSSGSSSDGNLTRGIYAESKSFMQFNNLRFTNFSQSGFEAKQVVYFTLTNITAADCLYGISFTSTISAPCTTCTVTSSYITGCARGIFQESGVQMIYKDCIFEYCGTSGGANGAFHANGGGALLIGAYFEANQRNIVASDTGLSFIAKYELAATAANVITYSGAPFNFRGTTDIESNTISTRFLAPDSISGYDLQMGTNLVAPLAGGSVVFGNETMLVANGTLTTATWTTVYTIPTAELSGSVNQRALYEYTCYAGTADLSTGFDSGTIMNGVLRSYSGTTPAWLRLSSNTVQMNVTGSSYGLLYKIVMRRVYPS